MASNKKICCKIGEGLIGDSARLGSAATAPCGFCLGTRRFRCGCALRFLPQHASVPLRLRLAVFASARLGSAAAAPCGFCLATPRFCWGCALRFLSRRASVLLRPAVLASASARLGPAAAAPCGFSLGPPAPNPHSKTASSNLRWNTPPSPS